MNTITTILTKLLKTSLFLLLNLQAIVCSANPPDLPLTCPPDQTAIALPGDCGAVINYDDLVFNINEPYTDFFYSPGPGNYFTLGLSPVTLTVITQNSGPQVCVFFVTVLEHNNGALVCDDSLFVGFEGECERALSYLEILKFGGYGCQLNLDVHILDDQGVPGSNILTSEHTGDTIQVMVVSSSSGLSCTADVVVTTDGLPPTGTCPPDLTIWCHQSSGPEMTGEPLLMGCLSASQLTIDYTDVQNNSFCNGDNIAYTIQRTWHFTDPSGSVSNCVQHIEAQRIDLDDIVFPPNFDNIDQPALSCAGPLSLSEKTDTSITGVPLVEGIIPAAGACALTIQFEDETTNLCGGKYVIEREWSVFDFCQSLLVTSTQTIVVNDNVGPSFYLPPTLYVTTNASCGTISTLPPFVLLKDCSNVAFRIETPWDTLLTNGGDLEIPFDSIGIFPIKYIATDACNNMTMKTANLVVTNELVSQCPPDLKLTCDQYNDLYAEAVTNGNLAELAVFGTLALPLNCEATLSETATATLDACGEGTLVRQITGGGQVGGTCTQFIQIDHVSDFVVQFPKDTTVQCGPNGLGVLEPQIFNETCENISIDFTDEIITPTTGGCFEIHRTWIVTNPCVTGANVDQEVVEMPESGLGTAFPLCDLDGDGDCDDRTFRDSWTINAKPTAAQASQNFNPDNDSDSNPWDGYISYVQIIKVIDTQEPVFANCQPSEACFTGADCFGEVTLAMPEVEDCGTTTVTAQLQVGGEWLDGFGPFDSLGTGSYPVRYFAEDLCGNLSTCETTVEVVDCEAPEAGCRAQLIVTLLPITSPPTVQVTASQLNQGSEDNCPGSLQFSFSQTVANTTQTFSCDDGIQDPIPVEIWVTDAAGNQSSCVSNIIIVTGPGVDCAPSMNELAGTIATESSLGINTVMVNLTGAMTSTLTTNANGAYNFSSPPSGTLTITPNLNTNVLNGVTTFDALLITKHILDIEPFDTPYKYIAADVNHSNTVTTLDALEIRKLILSFTTAFPNNTSWRFVPENYAFPNPANPFVPLFPEVLNVDLSNPGNLDFIGIKTGDVNGNAAPSLSGGQTEDRNFSGSLTFMLPDLLLKKGETVTLPFQPQAESLHGYQFALSFDPTKMELLEVLPGFSHLEDFGTNQLNDVILKTSWLTEEAFVPKKGSPAFSLRIKALAEARLADLIKVSPSAMAAEGYASDLSFLKVGLAFGGQSTFSESFTAFPARPNPFHSASTIGFEMPSAGSVHLTISDPSGRVVAMKEGYFQNGYNELIIRREELPAAGLYFYEIRTAAGAAVGRVFME